MKILSIILTLSIFAMVVTPCMDGEEHSFITECCVASHDNTENKQEPHSEDDCSPLCTCQCCGTFIITPQVAQFIKLQKPQSNTHEMRYCNDYYYQYTTGIWRPPLNA